MLIACDLDNVVFDSPFEVILGAQFDGWDSLPYLPGAEDGLDALRAAGHEVQFVTARSGSAVAPTVDWHRASRWADWPLHTAADDKSKVPRRRVDR